MCLTELANDNAVVRKRAGTAMGCLSVVLSDALLMRMVEALLSQIDMAQGVGKEGRRKTRSAHAQAKSTQTKRGDTCSLIRTMCTVSGAVGHRLGQTQIDRILPIFLRFAEPQDAATGDDEDMQDDDEMEESEDEAAVALANELRESCFMGFESFVLRCPNEVEPHMTKIIQAALAYMSYDPNYSYGAEDSDEEVDEDQEEEENDYDQDEEDLEEEDDDDSWKGKFCALCMYRNTLLTMPVQLT
jgi:cullin-associated NEDD8-dissociated protein 1